MDEEFIDPNDNYADGDNSNAGNRSTSDELPKDPLHRTVGILALILGLFVVAYFTSDSFWTNASETEVTQANKKVAKTSSASSSKRTNPSGAEVVSDKVKEITGLAVAATEQFDWAKEEEIAANRSVVESFKGKLASITRLSNSNSEELVFLQSKTEALRTSEAGAKIASDSKYVRQYIALHEKISEFTSSNSVADNFVKDMNALLGRVEEANDTGYSPQQFVLGRADEFVKSLKEKATELKRYDNAINGLVADTDQLQAGQLLETAIKTQSNSTDLKLAEALANARDEAIAATTIKLGEAEKEKVEADAGLVLAKLKADTKEVLSERDNVVTAAAKKRLEQEFNRDLNDVNVYLLPFISEGRNMRGNAGGKGPVSFSAIKAKGALENTADGLSSLSHAAKNGRPLGEFPINIRPFMISNNSTEGNFYNTSKYRSVEKYLEKAQSLLNKYGALMVEKGMLAE